MRRPAPSLTDRTAGVVACSLAVSIWGGTTVIVKAVEGVDGLGIAMWRLVLAAGLLAVVQLARRQTLSFALLRACTPGAVAFVADIAFYFTAVRETSTANATVIGALQPVLLLPFSARMFGERTTKAVLVWSAVAVAATAVVVVGGGEAGGGRLGGDLLAVGALLAWTAYFIVSRQARAHLGAFEYFAGLTVVAAVLVLPLALVAGGDLTPAGADDWLGIAALAVLSGAIGHVLLNWSHAHVPLQVMSLLTLLVPVVATAGTAVLLDEHVARLQVAGMVVVLAALAEVVRRTSADEVDEEEERGRTPAAA